MLKFREFTAKDAELIAANAVDSELRGKSGEWVKYWSLVCENKGFGYTAFLTTKNTEENKTAGLNADSADYADGKSEAGDIIGAAGVTFSANSCGTVWAIFTQQVRRYSKETLRSMRTVLYDFIVPECGLKKLRALSRVNFTASQRLLEAMGFVKKGKRGDYYLYIKQFNHEGHEDARR